MLRGMNNTYGNEDWGGFPWWTTYVGTADGI